MTRFALLAFCVTVTLGGVKAATPLNYGMTMSTRAYEAVCWYETLKIFPETHQHDYMQCGGQAEQVKQQIDNPDPVNKDCMDNMPGCAETMYGLFMNQMGVMAALPHADHYGVCNQYLNDANADPPSDESDALNDNYKSGYPYKAFANCLMAALRDMHGEEAIDAVKTERTHSLKNWMSTLLDRENEFRARHGSQPLNLVQDLTSAAQEWAETNARECQMVHSSHAVRKWNGKDTGESLSAGIDLPGGESVAAYVAADGWYEENKYYPFPEGYQGGNENLFKKIGHFTQSVWKDSKYVGYGYAENPNCKASGAPTSYIAARYYPAGNVDGQFPENVKPPQD